MITGLCIASVLRSHWVSAIKRVRSQNHRRDCEPHLLLVPEDGLLSVAGNNDFYVGLDYEGTWQGIVVVNLIAIALHLPKLPRTPRVTLAWADGALAVGSTKFPGQIIGASREIIEREIMQHEARKR
jgi:hypothetical protein